MRYSRELTFIHRYLSGEMDEIEAEEFNIWVGADDRNQKLFSEVSAIWTASSILPTKKFDANKAFLKHKSLLDKEVGVLNGVKELPSSIEIKNQSKVFSISPILAIAASFILLLAAWFIIANSNGKIYNSERSSIASLEDGSKVWMKEGSKIEFKEKSNKRLIELQGKAYFEVAKDDKKPFTVIADGLEVRVVGTIFTVDSKEKAVYVKEGIVEVYYNGEQQRLITDQMVNVQQGVLSQAKDLNFYKSGLWFNESLSFTKTPFDAVIKDVSDFFAVKFEIPQGRDWSNCTFTSGSLKNSTLEEIITTLKLTYELDCVKIYDKHYKISKVKCR